MGVGECVLTHPDFILFLDFDILLDNFQTVFTQGRDKITV